MIGVAATNALGSVGGRVEYAVEGSIPLLWSSDWSAATGFSDNAVMDDGKWDERRFDPNKVDLSVVTAASIGGGWPTGMDNVLKVSYAPPVYDATAEVEIHNRWAAMTSGDHLYGRVYVKTAFVNTGSQDGHFLQFEPGTPAFGWALKFGRGPNPPRMYEPQWALSKRTGAGGSESSNYYLNGFGTELTDEVWRVEWHWEFISANRYRFDTRWYDAADALRYTNNDFVYGDGPATLTSRDPLLILPDEWFRHIVIGNTGPNWTDDGFVYWGGVCIRDDDWCGSYDPNKG